MALIQRKKNMEANSKIINYSWDLKEDSSKEENFSLKLDYLDPQKQEDKEWQEKTGLDIEELTGVLESLIFMSEKPMALKNIKRAIHEELPLRVIHQCLEQLQKEYEVKKHGIRLVEVAGGYQFRTKPIYSKYIQNYYNIDPMNLTPSTLEVLALIAYRQPVSKTSIDEIRGVDSSHLVRTLIDKRLVKIGGRSESELGRPSVYETTDEFLDVFNLRNIEELPSESELFELATAKSVAEIGDIHKVVANDNRDKFLYDEVEELDQLGQKIRDIMVDTDFTKELKVQSRSSEEGEKRSAFDLLEDFIVTRETYEQNLQASKSEPMTTVGDYRVLSLSEDDFELALDQAYDDLHKDHQKLEQLQQEIAQKGDELDMNLNFLHESDNSQDLSSES